MFNSFLNNLSQKAIFGGFCEKQNLSFPIEVWNSISNVGYLAFAFVLSNLNKKDKVFSLLLTWVGISSFLYHAIFIRGYQILDLTAIILILSYIIFKLLDFKRNKNIVTSITLTILAVILNIILPSLGRSLVILFIVISIILLFKNYKRKSITPVLIFVIAFICWLLDSSLLCFPNLPFLSGHVLWHLLTAFGFYKIGKLIF